MLKFIDYCNVEITCASAADFLASMNRHNIDATNIKATDELHIQFTVSGKQLNELTHIAETHGAKIRLLNRQGLYLILQKIWSRPWLLVGVITVIFLTFFLSSHVLFINIEGNQHLPEHAIREEAEHCGIHFGAVRRMIRSEKVKNQLLSRLPQLQWVGINTTGCVATIIVKERDTAPDNEAHHSVGKIVATRDGIIRKLTVTKGNAQCKEGQAVKAGQILVSGYTDGGIAIKAEWPVAEIYAQTLRKLEAITPACYLQRDVPAKKMSLYSLRIGKNIIKFYKGSGILDGSCVKIQNEFVLKLPGGFALPIAFVKTDINFCDVQYKQSTNDMSYSWIKQHAQSYLMQQMLSGQILKAKELLQLSDEVCTFSGQYSCIEMIGKVKDEEIFTGDGKRD